jgi:hypothetical protein
MTGPERSGFKAVSVNALTAFHFSSFDKFEL